MVEKVFALGGSVISNHLDNLGNLAEALEQNEDFVAVVGAGHLKKQQDAVREECNNSEIDLVGIEATRLNAKTLQTLMENVSKETPKTVNQVQKLASDKNVVMGGLNPGFSTDAVAAIVAELFNADIYFITDVDGIYNSDPEKNQDAERFDDINTEELFEMTSGENTPGIYSIIDETAVQIIERSGLKAKLLEGDIPNVKDPENSVGTNIHSST